MPMNRSVARNCYTLWVSAAVLFVFSLTTVAQATVLSDFDDGTLQGWTPYLQIGSAEVTLVETGGNPGGHVHAVDTLGGGGTFGISAPAAFLGDLSGEGGLDWDERLLTASGLDHSTFAELVGADGTRYFNRVDPGSVGSWRNRFVAFTESEWTLNTASGSASFADVLSNVVELNIRMDVNSGTIPTLESDVDNIAIVPEPGSLALLALGLAGMLKRSERRN